MNEQQPEIEFEHDDFDFTGIEDELRVDELCQSLLKRFYLHLQINGHTPQQASDLAYSADLYLRDYVLDFSRQNVVRPQPDIVRKFAATWYITHTLDPEPGVLEKHLAAIRELYVFLHGLHLISADELTFLEKEVSDVDYYRKRIETFLAIQTDGYISWEAECPLKD
jgi:hypothetical protein